MIKFLLATHNQNKLREFRIIMQEHAGEIGEFELFSLDDIGCFEDVVENGTTFEENAMIKAKVGAALGYICFADDSGLAADALDGAPGIYSARYSGGHGNDEENNQFLLKNLEPHQDRRAKYVCAIACAFPTGEEFVVRGECHGVILKEYRGNAGFGYDPLFYVPQLEKTFAEATLEEKNKISHRGVATRLFIRELIKRMGEQQQEPKC